MFILHGNDFDPSMRYEGLARAAFDCERKGGPNGIADQEFFNNFVPEITPKAIAALDEILVALSKKTSGETRSNLLQVRSSLTMDMLQRTGIELIDYVIKICVEDIN